MQASFMLVGKMHGSGLWPNWPVLRRSCHSTPPSTRMRTLEMPHLKFHRSSRIHRKGKTQQVFGHLLTSPGAFGADHAFEEGDVCTLCEASFADFLQARGFCRDSGSCRLGCHATARRAPSDRLPRSPRCQISQKVSTQTKSASGSMPGNDTKAGFFSSSDNNNY